MRIVGFELGGKARDEGQVGKANLRTGMVPHDQDPTFWSSNKEHSLNPCLSSALEDGILQVQHEKGILTSG